MSSEIPLHRYPTLTGPCQLGIDEAGRGPVLGPMVYACAYWPKADAVDCKNLGFMDSKALDAEAREELFKKISIHDKIGYVAKSLTPQYISHSMLRLAKYNLNEISHDTAMDLIQAVLDKGVDLQDVFVDTVGKPEPYRQKILNRFPSLNVTVSEKADSRFPVVSAASICAKVIRDDILSKWDFEEPHLKGAEKGWGSGYPGDAQTKKWLVDNCDHLFGFPTVVRFSWKTTSNILEERGIPVGWGDEDEDLPPTKRRKVDAPSRSKSAPNILTSFTKPAPAKSDAVKPSGSKRKRSSLTASDRDMYFSMRNLIAIDNL